MKLTRHRAPDHRKKVIRYTIHLRYLGRGTWDVESRGTEMRATIGAFYRVQRARAKNLHKRVALCDVLPP